MTFREAWRVVLGYLAAAVLFTWPLARAPFDRLAAPIGPGDPYLNLWILGWDLGTISRDPLALVTLRVFDANIFHPAAQTLTYSDHLIPQALLLWPAWALTGNVTFCYNLLLLLSMAASGVTMYLFARAVTGSRAGAALAGLAWAVFPSRFAHLLHLQLQSLYVLPVAFYFLHRVMAGRRRRDAVALGLAAGVQAASSVYWGVIGAVAIGVAALALAVGIGRWRSSLILRRLLLAGVVGAFVVAPFAWPYWQSQRREGFARNLFAASQHEATLRSYVRVPPGNVLYGRTGVLRPDTAPGKDRHEGPEQELFPGFVLVTLAVYGAVRAWTRDQRPLVLAMVTTALTGVILSLGPGGWRAAYSLAYDLVFGFQAIRAPARFGVLPVFAAATLAAVGLREISSRFTTRPGGRGWQPVAPVALALLSVGVEFLNVPLPTVPAPPVTTPAGQWLARAEEPGAVLYFPIDGNAGDTEAMVDSLQHRRPIVNGNSGQRPAFFMGLLDTLHQLPSVDALWALRDLGVRYVVSSKALASDGRPTPLVERARFDRTWVYEVRWTAELEAAVPRPALPPPPAAGSLPFSREERTVYQVAWLSPPALNVPAGTATLMATPAEDGRGQWHFAIDVETADWVSRFFEARDRFETWTDSQLLPLVNEQHIREGRRVLDRTTTFDAAAGVVTVGQDGPRLPLPVGARDALSAFFYARTLPLAPGYEVTFPVTEGGRTTETVLKVVGVEPVTIGGRQVEAWRLEPRFETRLSHRRPIQAAIWISRDARRLPLRILVESGFGDFRVELASHEAR